MCEKHRRRGPKLPLTRILLMISVGLPVWGCAAAGHPVSKVCDSGLQLSLHSKDGQAIMGENLEVSFVLLNTSKNIIEACFGSAFEVTFSNDSESEGWFEAPKRKGCIERFVIRPGEQATRVYEVLVPRRFEGPARLFGSVHIVEPSDCDDYGCGGAWLRSTTHPEVVIRSASK